MCIKNSILYNMKSFIFKSINYLVFKTSVIIFAIKKSFSRVDIKF